MGGVGTPSLNDPVPTTERVSVIGGPGVGVAVGSGVAVAEGDDEGEGVGLPGGASGVAVASG